jgi:hypothetical protein
MYTHIHSNSKEHSENMTAAVVTYTLCTIDSAAINQCMQL